MENRFKSLTIFDFQKRFPNDDACYEYLLELKWKNGFVCPHCG
ncbi:MAG: transposase, partial [Prolixibacteraceae bacterium]|nr:transposase [Prolixibacteraceae bacterium]